MIFYIRIVKRNRNEIEAQKTDLEHPKQTKKMKENKRTLNVPVIMPVPHVLFIARVVDILLCNREWYSIIGAYGGDDVMAVWIGVEGLFWRY